MHLRNSSGRRPYTNKFKLEAINLANQVGNRQVARDLDINESSIKDWKRQQLKPPPQNKVCCISNAMDVSENDILYAHRFEEKEEEVVDDPTDPHEDMLTDRDWQRLENHNVDYEEELETEI